MEEKSLRGKAVEAKRAIEKAAIESEQARDAWIAEQARRVRVSRERAMEFVEIMKASEVEPSTLLDGKTIVIDKTPENRLGLDSIFRELGRGWVVRSQYIDLNSGWKTNDDSYPGIIVLDDGRTYAFTRENGLSVHIQNDENRDPYSFLSDEQVEALQLGFFAEDSNCDLLVTYLVEHSLVG